MNHSTNQQRRDAIFMRLRGTSLDRRLAAGEAPTRDRLLAARAALITSPDARAALARQWVEVTVRAHRRGSGRRAQVPVSATRLTAATDQVLDVVAALRSGRPVSAAGVAAARLLLTSASSPVYGIVRDGDLTAALTRAIAGLHRSTVDGCANDRPVISTTRPVAAVTRPCGRPTRGLLRWCTMRSAMRER